MVSTIKREPIKQEDQFPSFLALELKELNDSVSTLDTVLSEREKELVITSDKAERANKTKSAFLANMSHEIRTPMNGIMGMAEMMLETNLNAHQKTYAETIYKSATSLLTIINDILDFSKIEAGKVTLEAAPFDLHKEIADIVVMIAAKAKNKNISVSHNYDPTLPKYYIGDSGRIRQIITNIIGNAEKFTHNGHIIVNISGIKDDKASQLKIEIKDTGIGIPKHKLSKVFEEFEQVDGISNRNYEGTGLGLAISSRLIKMMGGHILVESTVNKGSTFTLNISLPFVDALDDGAKMLGDESVGSIVSDLSGINILLAEDNKTNQMVIKSMLKSTKTVLTMAADGCEAIDLFPTLRPDIILMDMFMPNMDGLEATRQIRTLETKSNWHPIPIIALTANAMVGDKERCLSAGMNDYLSKPIHKKTLLDTLQKWAAHTKKHHSVSDL